MNLRTIGIILSVILALTLVGCGQSGHEDHREHASKDVFTCPMHPSVMQDQPGKCPVCGMDLVPAGLPAAKDNAIMLSDAQMKLANIKVRHISEKMFGTSAVVNGRLAFNLDKSEVISSRVAGRVEHLAVKETGIMVKKGEPLYRIYSEALLTLQEEYLLAKEQYEQLGQTPRYKSLLDAAAGKLRLYGMTNTQINNLKSKRSSDAVVTFFAPATGVVTEVSVSEGEYVNEGTAMMRIENINTLWVEAELYSGETELFKRGKKIKVTPAGWTSAPVEGTITFLSPEITAGSRTTIMRAMVDNTEGKLMAGQQVSVTIAGNKNTSITLPQDAVIRSSDGSHVYVQRGRNTFAPRAVTTGVENGFEVEIIDGLTQEDTVAVSGAYLLYSELVLKNGVDPGAVHDHH